MKPSKKPVGKTTIFKVGKWAAVLIDTPIYGVDELYFLVHNNKECMQQAEKTEYYNNIFLKVFNNNGPLLSISFGDIQCPNPNCQKRMSNNSVKKMKQMVTFLNILT